MTDDPADVGDTESRRQALVRQVRSFSNRLARSVSSRGARYWERLRPVVREQLTDWPEAIDRRVDLTGDDPVELGSVPEGGPIVLYIHGFLGQGRLEVARISGRHQAAALQAGLEEAFADRSKTAPTVVAGMWHSSTTWPRAKRHAEEAGEQLVTWLEERTASSVTIVAHSLGARVTLTALNELEGDRVDSVALLGAAVDPDAVCYEFRDGIASLDRPVYNYYSTNDRMVCRLYRVGELFAGLGCRGSDCRGGWRRSAGYVPENFEDIDVSEQVHNHLDYYKPSKYTVNGNCVGNIVANQL